jgi:ABC-type Na+ efflux pump permease subunit
MRAFAAIVGKDLRLLLRDRAGLFFTLIFPLLIAVLFGAVFGGGGSQLNAVLVAVVDEDVSPRSEAFLHTLLNAPELDIDLQGRDDAFELVRQGKRTAFVVLPNGFDQALGPMFSGKPASIEIGVDPSRHAEASMLQGILMRHVFDAVPSESRSPSFASGLPVFVKTTDVVKQGRSPPNGFAVSFPQGMIWGLMMSAMTFGMGLITE